MTEFFDTSVLVAAFWGDHPHHARSLNLLAGADPSTASCAAHSLAEVHAVLTRLPVRPPVLPEHAVLFLQDVRARLTIIELNEDDYFATLEDASDQSISGGQVYDALLLRCAVKAGAESIFTWNREHFQVIAPELSDRIRTP